MKTLLLNPPTLDNKRFTREGRCTQERGVWGALWPPFSLAMIGAVLRQDGHAVTIVDAAAEGIRWDALPRVLDRSRPQAVIWSTGSPSLQSDLGLASVVKEHDRKTACAVFGTHVTALDQACLRAFPDVDFIIRNEPEDTARELLAVLRDGDDAGRVLGLTHRGRGGQIVRNPARPFRDDLDSLPLPAWDLIETGLYRLPFRGRRFLIVTPMRGCPYPCTFCTCQIYYGSRRRYRSVESVLEEIERAVRDLGIRDFLFWAETFTADKEYVRALCSGILERGLRISWVTNSRVDTMERSLSALMAKAGCWMISLGIESGDQGVLDEARKGSTVPQAGEAVRIIREAGMRTVGHFMLGLPGDTEESMCRTVRQAGGLGLDFAQFYCAVPFPGSGLYERAVREGWIAEQDGSGFHQNEAVMRLPAVSPQRVCAHRRAAYRKFYCDPRRVFSVLCLAGAAFFRSQDPVHRPCVF